MTLFRLLIPLLISLIYVLPCSAAPFLVSDLTVGKVIPVHVYDYYDSGDAFEWDGNYHITGVIPFPGTNTSIGNATPHDLYYNVLRFNAPIDSLTNNRSGSVGIVGVVSLDPLSFDYQYYSLYGYLTDEPINGLLVTYDQFLYLWNTQVLQGKPLDINGLNSPTTGGDDDMTDAQMTAVFTHMSSQTSKLVTSNNAVLTVMQATPDTVGKIVSMCIGAAASYLLFTMINRRL